MVREILNNNRKFFPGFRVLEGIIIAVVSAAVIGVGSWLLLIPQLGAEMKFQLNSLCSSVEKIEKSVKIMGDEIVNLKIQDVKHDGDINVIRNQLRMDKVSKAKSEAVNK